MLRTESAFRHGSGLNRSSTGGKGFASQSATSMVDQPDVFTVEEIAGAAGVPRASVQRLGEEGELKPVAGSIFFAFRAAVRAARRARPDAASLTVSLSSSSATPATTLRESRGFRPLCHRF